MTDETHRLDDFERRIAALEAVDHAALIDAAFARIASSLSDAEDLTDE